ncbi:MAG TPA: type I pullulanase [Mucilaginibacter sp.]|nr:type I pullulanase [Mucilaginibacter sp.]
MKIVKPILAISFLAIILTSATSITKTYLTEEYPAYNGNDLGVNWSAEQTLFKIWAPTATAVKLRLFAAGEGGKPLQTINLTKAKDGVWETTVKENLKNQYYTFQANINGKWLKERPDIYAKAVGVNGKRGMVADMVSTNPKGWQLDKKPEQKNFTDIMIYELHVRDLSMDPNSGIQHKGKFLGLTETKTKSPDGTPTGLDHIKSLGVTHIHLLPSFDYNSVDEANSGNKYNWGYDPLNYNVPEGSYATDAYDGNVRIREFKKMVQTLHANGLRVILDVVYNHTSDTSSNFNQFAPGYFYRHTDKGAYSNATACGNETASEKAMMRKYMIESVVYWAKEYHLDGFRFDLMGVHDIETMNDISSTLHKIDPTIFVYGEGWTAGNSPLAEDLRAVKKNAYKLDKVAVFSDDIRDGIKGGWSDVKTKGFVSGAQDAAESVKFGIVGSVQHPQVDYNKVNYSKAPWAAEPHQTINYASCHDDNTLWDRLKISNPSASEADLIRMDKLSNTIVFTSQGVAFMHAGAEMLRTKQGVANSYNSPDAINQLDWSRKVKYKEVFNYYRTLIALRKHHPAFRMPSAKMIREHLKFIETGNPNMIAYQISDNANGDAWKNILVVFNGSLSDGRITIPEGRWRLAIDGKTINEKSMKAVGGGQVVVPATSAYLLFEL